MLLPIRSMIVTKNKSMNKDNTLTRKQIQDKFIEYLNTLSDKDLTKLVKKVKPDLIENLTLKIS